MGREPYIYGNGVAVIDVDVFIPAGVAFQPMEVGTNRVLICKRDKLRGAVLL